MTLRRAAPLRMPGARLAMASALCLLAACGGNERRDILREIGGGQDIRVRLSTGETRRDVTVAVRPPGLPHDTALAAAGYEVARHCIRWTGRSTAEWVTDAQGRPQGALTEDARVFSARCAGR